jgi:hypothetical protein
MQTYSRAQLVKLAPDWLDTPEEAEARYVVIEDNGDRCIVQLICDLPIPPQETLRKEMIVPVEE